MLRGFSAFSISEIIHFILHLFYVLPIVHLDSCTGRCAITRTITQRYFLRVCCCNPKMVQKIC